MHTTGNKFSVMVHQHNNAYVKGSDNQGARRRRMITGPELAKIHLEVEEQTKNQHDGAYDTGHQHRQDQQSGVQAASVKEDKALVTMLEEMGNPFPEHKQCLLIIARIMVKHLRMIMTIVGFSLHQVCDGNSRKVYNTCHTQTLQNINMSLFGKLPDASKSTQKTQLASTNSDGGSFSSLYVSCQTRDGYIDNFVSHENHSTPSTLSTGG